MEHIKTPPIILSIAGSDSGGGAGVQADIKTISALGGFATTAITALTAQNTQGVREVHPVSASHVTAQIEAVLEDMGADAVKIGMLHNAQVIDAVAAALVGYDKPIVLDPVMVATSGDRLLDDAAMAALERFLPRASVITPNIPEAEALLETTINSRAAMEAAAQTLAEKYRVAVLLKGGHLDDGSGEMADLLCRGHVHEPVLIEMAKGDRFMNMSPDPELFWLIQPRINTTNTHGTGCTLSSALATYLGQGMPLPEATQKAQAYVHGAIQHAPNIGKGNGPLNHGWKAI